MLCRCPLLLLAALLVAASCLPAGQIRVCGPDLANVLAAVCKGRGYNDPFSRAPSAGSTQSPPKRSAELPSGTKGVADECCRNGCTYKTIEQYCSPVSSSESRTSASGSVEMSTWVGTAPSPSRPPLQALVDQSVERMERVESQQTTTPAPPPFRVGIINSYFDGFILPPDNRINAYNHSEVQL